MVNDEVREAVDRVERALAEVMRAVNEVRIGQATAAGDLRVVTDKLSTAVDRLAHVAEKATQSGAWWESRAALVFACSIALLIVGRELGPALIALFSRMLPGSP